MRRNPGRSSLAARGFGLVQWTHHHALRRLRAEPRGAEQVLDGPDASQLLTSHLGRGDQTGSDAVDVALVDRGEADIDGKRS